MRVLIGCECSGIVRDAFRALGHDAWSCDLKPTERPGNHYQCDLLEVLNMGWDLMIAHPDCTYLTCSAEWAYKDPDYVRYPPPLAGYHQKLKPGTLFGAARREARRQAVRFVKTLGECCIPRVAIENPRGHLSSAWRKPDQTIQPFQYGDDASKATCLWLRNLPALSETDRFPGRWVEWPRGSGKMVERWSNQTDGGQNKETPSEDRATNRSRTYEGVARAIASQWGATAIQDQPSLFSAAG